jgi:hypothetical protein
MGLSLQCSFIYFYYSLETFIVDKERSSDLSPSVYTDQFKLSF